MEEESEASVHSSAASSVGTGVGGKILWSTVVTDSDKLESVFDNVVTKIAEAAKKEKKEIDIKDDEVLAPIIKKVLGEMNITASGAYGPKCKMFRAYNNGEEVIVKPAPRKTSGTKRKSEESAAAGGASSSSSAPKAPKKARTDISALTASLPPAILSG
jgi:hypothetical protein